MRILVLSDLHSNWPALSVIREPFDVCLCLGDFVDYGPDPSPCVAWAMEHVDHAVRGNHDHAVAQNIAVIGETGFRYLTRVSRSFQWPALDPAQRRYLTKLPLTRQLTLDGLRYFLVHGTPRDPLDEYLLRDKDAWRRRLESVDADIVCVGHTHMQFQLELGNGKTVLNPGSVGLPRDGDPRVAYAVIEHGQIQLKRVAYDIDATIAHLENRPIPEPARRLLAQCLRLGRMPAASTPASSPASSATEASE